jgi:hypothetical protein
MQRRDLPTSNPDRKKLWSFMTVHMTRRASDYFRHGVESETPRIHELVMMNDDYLLKKWLVEHPDDLENRFRLKTPLLLAIKQTHTIASRPRCKTTLIWKNTILKMKRHF